MKITTEKTQWLRLYMDTPIAPPENPAAREALKPGTCVQARDVLGHEELLGRVHLRGPAEYAVIGHGWDNSEREKWVWTGSEDEFNSVWSGD